MAVTISRYNHTIKLLLNQEVDLANLKAMLLDSNAVFTATDVDTTDVLTGAATEVSGNGWDAGGEVIGSVAVTTVDTNDAMIDAADLSITATGADIGPASAALIYDATNDLALWYVDFGGSETAGVGTDFKITWNASGIARVTG